MADIKSLLDDPDQLERLYRENRRSFEKEFRNIYDDIKESDAARFWKSRLDYSEPGSRKIFAVDLILTAAVCIVAGILIKVPEIFGFNAMSSKFYVRDIALIVFGGLSAYTMINARKPFSRNNYYIILFFIIACLYINLIPDSGNRSSVNLVYIHLPLLLWCAYGLSYISYDYRNLSKRVDFIKYCGELVVMTGLIILAGGVLMVISEALFQAIGMSIVRFYTMYIVQIGFVSAPVVASFILKYYSSVTNKIAPVIANLFSPLVALTLVIYLAAMAIKGKDPYNDRDFLLIFNLLLIGVMALIVFSVSETSLLRKQRINEIILFVLSIVTLLVNLIALSAIFYRLTEFGFTPNRLAVLGSNILIFINLILLSIDLFKISFRSSEIEKVELTISKFLPVYVAWTIFVVFILPFVFGLK